MATQTTARKRKAHIKSRRGCAQCKQRHHKCDEERPRCGDCERLKTACSFELVASLPTANGTHELIAPYTATIFRPSTTPDDVSATSNLSDAEQPVSVLDLELLSNFLTKTMPDLMGNEMPYQGAVAHYADIIFSRTYLLHSVLALSALHLLSQNQARKDLLNRATYLQSTALTSVKPHLTSVPEEQIVPLLFFAAHTAIYSMAEAVLHIHANDDRSFDPIPKIVDSFRLIRGIRIVIGPHWAYIKTSKAGTLLAHHIDEKSNHQPEPGWDQQPQYRMMRTLAFGLKSKDDRTACLAAIESIFRSISMLQLYKDPRLSNRILQTWVMELDDVFQNMLAQHKPVALVVLAHYAVLLSLGSGTWWVASWPKVLIERAEELLGDEWAEFLRWPKEMVFGTVQRDISRNCDAVP